MKLHFIAQPYGVNDLFLAYETVGYTGTWRVFQSGCLFHPFKPYSWIRDPPLNKYFINTMKFNVNIV